MLTEQTKKFNKMKTFTRQISESSPKSFFSSAAGFHRGQTFSLNEIVFHRALMKKNTQKLAMNLRAQIKKKMEKQSVRFKEKLYSPLYEEIHKTMLTINREIRIGRKILNKNRIFAVNMKYPKTTTNINKSQFRTGVSGEIKNAEQVENIASNFQLMSPAYKRYKSEDLFSKTLPRFNNNRINNNIKPTNTKLYIETYNDNQNLNNSITEKEDDINRRKSREEEGERKLKLNITINNDREPEEEEEKEEEVTPTIKKLEKDLQRYRYKTLYVSYDSQWYTKNKLIRTRLDDNIISNPSLQEKIIEPQLNLIFENMKIFQSKYLVDSQLFSLFEKLTWFQQKNINIKIEETVGLLIEISYLLLGGYKKYLSTFVSNPLPRITKKKKKKIKDEVKEFSINMNLFSDAFIFLKVCFDAYQVILTHQEGYFVDQENFHVLFQYLERARFNSSKICLDLRNVKMDQLNEEKKILENCLKQMKVLKNKNKVKNMKKVDCHLERGVLKSTDPFLYEGPKKIQLSDELQTIIRIKKALGPRTSREHINHLKMNLKKFDLNSPLVEKLLKYSTREFRANVIAERIRQRYAENNNE